MQLWAETSRLMDSPEHHTWEKLCQNDRDLQTHPTQQVKTDFIATAEYVCALL